MGQNITLRNLTVPEPTLIGPTGAFADTTPGARDGTRGGGGGGGGSATLLFSENFSNQPEYNSALDLAVGGVTGWDYRRQGRNGELVWAPSVGYPDKHEAFYITGTMPEALRNGTKAMVCWRESYDAGWNNFNSDGILTKEVPGQDTLFVEFYVKFLSGWTPSGQSKLFRISSLESGYPVYGFGSNQEYGNGPIVLWDYQRSISGGIDYGVRNFIALRGGHNHDNYYMANPAPTMLPRNMNNGDLTCNFGGNVTNLNQTGTNNDPYISKVTGLPCGDVASHEDVYGYDWNKIQFFVQMNSAPGATDGVLKQWINDHLVFSNEVMPWVGVGGPINRKWNTIHFGGNDFFRFYPNEDQYEEPYAIADIEIWDGIPAGRIA